MRDAPSDDEEKAAKGKDDSRWVDENVKMNRLYLMSLAKDANGKREPKKLTTGDYNVEATLTGHLTVERSLSRARKCRKRITGPRPIC